MSDYCCNNPRFVHWSLKHDPVPMRLSIGQFAVLEHFLWYAPTDKSPQAYDNEAIHIKAYDDFFWGVFLKAAGLDGDDVLTLDDGDDTALIEEQYVSVEDVCVNCQKIVMRLTKKRTRIEQLLSHLRNCIAHGRFNIVDGDLLIGHDRMPGKQANSFFKLRLSRLSASMLEMENRGEWERFVGEAFAALGYAIVSERQLSNGGSSCVPDLVVQKGDRLYLIEIIRVGGNYIDVDKASLVLERIINHREFLPNNAVVVVFLDKNRVSKAVRELFFQQGVGVIDANGVKSLLAGGFDPFVSER